MFLSSKDKIREKEFSIIFEPEHRSKVWKIIEEKFHEYFNMIIKDACQSPVSEIDRLKKKFSNVSPSVNIGQYLDVEMSSEIENFEKTQKTYKNLFSKANIEEYASDTKLFRSDLKNECPVIRGLWNSKDEELKKWKEAYKYSNDDELYEVMANIVNFSHAYAKSMKKKQYGENDDYAKLNFDCLDGIKDDTEPDYGLVGVVGYGIMSIIMYHFYPQYFPLHLSGGIYALYFLSDKYEIGMPSKSSEFLMIDDSHWDGDMHFKMKHNYFYPYRLYTWYALRLYRLLKTECAKHNFTLDDAYRYVYLNSFCWDVCRRHTEEIRTMVGADEDPNKRFWY